MVLPNRFPFYPECVPKELKEGKFWVCCDQNKVPEIPGTNGRRASSTDSATWRSYGEAAAWYASGHHAGVGRVITHEDPYVGVDLDGCRDPRTGEIEDWALDVLEDLDSYGEVSPSGKGIKVWVRARLERSYVKPGWRSTSAGGTSW